MAPCIRKKFDRSRLICPEQRAMHANKTKDNTKLFATNTNKKRMTVQCVCLMSLAARIPLNV